ARGHEDDWTGKTSAKERRKLQNRLHQRAWRRRKAERNDASAPEIQDPRPDPLSSAFAAATAAIAPTQDPPSTLTDALTRIPPFAYSPGYHYLLTLIQYNVMRAVITNLSLCQILQQLPLECRAALNIPLIHHPPSTLPPTFTKTKIQREMEHNSWIDAVVCAQLRDNLILAAAGRMQGCEGRKLDEDELCDDVCGGLYEGYDDSAARGLLVWSDPWRVSSWEISPGFAAKWGFLLRGCREMVESTNRWREARGEEPLVIEVE
ncbi:hypothetical protein BU26DRAFT_423746, partial [Trematosphaeria pertusa]